ncbi:Zinc finger, CCHC-type [Cucumis melo var. makuwa]|uniref:Zinc finger, CCHC-type n=1 Tax=Cucumis melo var. makuwa TaxID=1194695 RepID=A0A5A7U8K5_CUCMM|nr:Zinc finger, CCHC-type [Cucumis melo var. makuwa]
MGDLWDVCGTEVNPPEHVTALNKWNVKAETPKKAWDTFASLFLKKNDARLQFLEIKLLSIAQWEMIINQYFTKKVRSKGVEETLKGSQVGGASKNDRLQGHRTKGECYYNCGKIGHYARECHRKKKTIESNAVTSLQVESISEEEWDAGTCCATIDFNPQSTSNAKENQVLACHVEEVNYENDWIIDLGCSNPYEVLVLRGSVKVSSNTN